MERNIKHIIQSGGIYLLLLLFSACGQEEMLPDYLPGGEATFSLRPVAMPMSGAAGTRAGGPDVINEYTVLVYQKTGTGTPAENKLVMKKHQQGGDPLSFTAEQVKGVHYIYLLANVADKLAALVPNESTEQDLLNIQVDAGKTTEGSVSGGPSGIMVSSRITLPNFSVADFYQATSTTGEIPVKQIVARLVIHFSVSSDVFMPQEVSYLSMSGGSTYLIGRKNTDTSNYLPKITRTNGGWGQPMYLYDQASIRNGEANQWKNPGFFLVLKGTYKKGGTQYFKFALPGGIGTTFGDINRNVSYTLDITDINNYGYTTAEMAENPQSLFSNVIASINPDMAGMENYKELYTNGYYMMGLNSTEFYFSQVFADKTPYLLTEVNYKPLDPSVASDRLSLLPGHSSEITLLSPTSGPNYIVFTPPDPGVSRDYTATICYGTLRKPITVSVRAVTTVPNASSMKFKASNGSVSKFTYNTVSAAGKSYHQPILDTGWTWTPTEWCGLGPNSRFNPAYYFGDISTSLNENIFVHIRPITAPSTYDGSLRQVYLIADDHVIDVRVGKTN